MILGSLTERITCTTIKHKIQETQRIFLRETIKDKPHNFLRDRISTKSKTRKHKDDLHSFCLSLSHLRELLLSHSCAPVSECVYVINRESHSLFILFHSLYFHYNMSTSLNNYLLEPASLGVPNKPSVPKLWGL